MRAIRAVNGKTYLAKATIADTRSLLVAFLFAFVLIFCSTTQAQTLTGLSGLRIPTATASTNLPPGTNVFVNPSELAIDGPGYFVVRDPDTGLVSATRFGDFSLDTDGFLVTDFGKHLQGYTNSALTGIGDLRVDSFVTTNGMIIGQVSSWEIQSNGVLMESFEDGSTTVNGQILLQNFQNASALAAQGWRYYGWSSAAGPLNQPAPPGSAGTGMLIIGQLEKLIPKLEIGYQTDSPLFSQGVLTPTGEAADIGIEGNGFFVLRDTNDNSLHATRAGTFYVDGGGYFVHYSGLRLQGFVNSSFTSIGDLQIDSQGMPVGQDVAATGYGIDPNGVVTEYLSDGAMILRGQILLAACGNPNGVTHANFDLYAYQTTSDLWSSLSAPNSGGLGWLVSGSLELNQLDANLLAVRSHINFFTEGPILFSDFPSHLAISGYGFFTMRDPVSNALYAARRGAFSLDTSGYLVNSRGWRVQGLTNNSLSQNGDIVIDAFNAGIPNEQMANYTIDHDGVILVTASDGTQWVRGQVLLQSYRNLQALVPIGAGVYSNVISAQPIYTNISVTEYGVALISGALEQPLPAPAALQLRPSSGMRLFISNVEGGTVETSTDLTHWTAIGEVAGSPDLNEAEFFDAPQGAQNFYRVISPSN